jgi:hypothetical protein
MLIYKFLTLLCHCVPTMDAYPFLPSFRQGVFTTAACSLLYGLLRVIYNVYFHPLSRFPGPRGAACTGWWLAYMELGRGVSLSTLRAQLHGKYGTDPPSRSSDCSLDPWTGDIVRIAPNEVIISTSRIWRIGTHCQVSFPRSSTLQDRRCMTKSTLLRTNGRRIMDFTGLSTWTSPPLRRRTTLKRSTVGRSTPISFPEKRL